jgi:hypothetical protein
MRDEASLLEPTVERDHLLSGGAVSIPKIFHERATRPIVYEFCRISLHDASGTSTNCSRCEVSTSALQNFHN